MIAKKGDTMKDLRRVCVKPYDKDKFELIEDYEFYLPSLNGKIPKGFKTNGADIPRIFWSLFPPYASEYFSAVVIHDFLCQKASSKADYILADYALKEAMSELGCSKFKTLIFYLACYSFHTLKCFFKSI